MSKTALRLQNKKPKQHLQKKYQVKVSLSYNGTINVEADSKKDAVNRVNYDIDYPQTINTDVFLNPVVLKFDKKKKHIR